MPFLLETSRWKLFGPELLFFRSPAHTLSVLVHTFHFYADVCCAIPMTSQHISQHVERDAELAEPFQTSVLAAMKDPNMAERVSPSPNVRIEIRILSPTSVFSRLHRAAIQCMLTTVHALSMPSQYNTTQHGTVRHGTALHDTIQRPGMPKYDPRCLAYYWNWFNKTGVDYYLNNYVGPIAAMDGYGRTR